MEYSNTTTKDGIVQEIDRICNSNDNSYPIANKTARVNAGIDHFYTIALQYDQAWLYDDPNQTNLPIATRSIVNGQQDYAFASELLTVDAVFIKDPTTGDLKEITEETDPKNTFMRPSGNSGTPTKFRVIGNSILLDFIPNYDLAAGIKVAFSRTGTRMLATDTTKIPGIPTIFHPWLAQYASLPYLIEKQKPQKNDYAALVSKGESDIQSFMAMRNNTRKSAMIPETEDNH